jgi:serine O-acetyltransferase
MELSAKNVGKELERWFSKSIIATGELDFNDSETFSSAIIEFKADYGRYYPEDLQIDLEKLILRHELVGIFLYRIARIYHLKNNDSCNQYSLLGRFLSGMDIYYSASIGSALKINHGLGTVIGARAVIGNNALIHQGVTIGGKNDGRPIIKNNVTIYAGAIILGPITIGDNAIIGANSVCMIDVPDNATVAGIPAKVISK